MEDVKANICIKVLQPFDESLFGKSRYCSWLNYGMDIAYSNGAMKRLARLILFLTCLIAHAQQPSEFNLGLGPGVSFSTETNKTTMVIKPLFELNNTWDLGRLYIRTGADVASLIPVDKTNIQFDFDGDVSLGLDLTNQKCEANEEKYLLGLTITPGVISNPIFFSSPFYSTTLGIDAEARIGVLDMKIRISPLEMLNIKQQYTSAFCTDVEVDLCLDAGETEYGQPLMDCNRGYYAKNQVKASCRLFKKKIPANKPYKFDKDGAPIQSQKLSYIDANIAYQYTVPRKFFKVEVCLGLQTTMGNKGAGASYINYYCTTGMIWMIPLKKGN